MSIGTTEFSTEDRARLGRKFCDEHSIVKYNFEGEKFGRVVGCVPDGLYLSVFNPSTRKFSNTRTLVYWMNIIRNLSADEQLRLLDIPPALPGLSPVRGGAPMESSRR